MHIYRGILERCEKKDPENDASRWCAKRNLEEEKKYSGFCQKFVAALEITQDHHGITVGEMILPSRTRVNDGSSFLSRGMFASGM